MIASEEKKLYRLDEVAQAFGVTADALERWIKRGWIAVVRIPSGRRRITVQEFNRVMEITNKVAAK